MKTHLMIFAALTALSACGGSTATTPGVQPAPQPAPTPTTRSAGAVAGNVSSATVIDTVAVDYSESTSQFTFASNGTAITDLMPEASFDNGRLMGYNDGAADGYAYVYRSAGSMGAVLASDGETPEYGGVTFRRIGSTTVPTTGAATYTGDYAGMMRNDTVSGGNDDVQFMINGDLTLAANFANNTVQGAITNREARSRFDNMVQAGTPIDDVTLQSAALDSSVAFSGTTVGGRRETAGWSVNGGAYNGVVTGATGNEVIGGLTINHVSPSNTKYTEIGLFAGNN